MSPEIVKLSTALVTYKENPHIDTKERGMQAAQIMAGIVSGKVKPVQAIAKPPMVYNIVSQYTKREPLLPIVEESRRLENESEDSRVQCFRWIPICRCPGHGSKCGRGHG